MLSGNDVQNAAIIAAELDITTSTLGIHKPFEPEDHDLGLLDTFNSLIHAHFISLLKSYPLC